MAEARKAPSPLCSRGAGGVRVRCIALRAMTAVRVTVFWQWSGAGTWAGLQHLCLGQGTCPRGLEEARAQKGSWLCVCQGSVSLPSAGSVFGPGGHGVSWSRDSCASQKGSVGHRGTRGLAEAVFVAGVGRGVSISWREMMVLSGVG